MRGVVRGGSWVEVLEYIKSSGKSEGFGTSKTGQSRSVIDSCVNDALSVSRLWVTSEYVKLAQSLPAYAIPAIVITLPTLHHHQVSSPVHIYNAHDTNAIAKVLKLRCRLIPDLLGSHLTCYVLESARCWQSSLNVYRSLCSYLDPRWVRVDCVVLSNVVST